MKRPRCFIVQEPVKRDPVTRQLVPLMNFKRVLDYGDPVVLLQQGRVGFSPGPTIDTIRKELRDFTDNDYIVSTGDPTAIFVTAMVAGEINNGRCKLLKWDKVARKYISVSVDIHYRTRKEN